MLRVVMSDAKATAPSVERNRDPILAVLQRVLPDKGDVLEIASGTGEHAVYFAKAMPNLIWHPSDPSPEARASIDAWRDDAGLDNVEPAVPLDTTKPWPVDLVHAVVCINMIHISPWESTISLFDGASSRVRTGGPVYLYGPFRVDGEHTAPSNAEFEDWLKSQDERYGVRDMGDVTAVAQEYGFRFDEKVEMPANNFSLVFRKI